MSCTLKGCFSQYSSRLLKSLCLLLLLAGLAGCKPKNGGGGASGPGGTAGAEGITGVPGYPLGSNLAENLELKPQEDGSLMYFEPDYTNVPPFENLSVFATPGRQIYMVRLKAPGPVDSTNCADLGNSLARQYGNRRDENNNLYRTMTFGSGEKTGMMRLTYSDLSLELTYSTTQTNH